MWKESKTLQGQRCQHDINVRVVALEVVDFPSIPLAVIPLNFDRLIQRKALATVSASRWRSMIHDWLDATATDIWLAITVVIAYIVRVVVVDLTLSWGTSSD